jgi:teichuronic acid biosynthesis glycosyltransferase TuaC
LTRRSRFLTYEHRSPDARVLVVTNMWPHPGNPRYGVFIKRQVDSLIEAGLRCDVIFIRGFESRLAYPAAALSLLRLSARKPGYRLVHCHGGETALAARFYLGAPLLASYCGDDLLGTPAADGRVPLRSRLRRSLQRVHSRLVTTTITKSREMEDVLPGRVGARNSVVPNGVDDRLFSPRPRDQARQRLGWPLEDRVALFVADPAVPRKRHWLARAACERARERLPGVRLEVVADAEPGDVPLLMSAADCLLLTSSIEGSPNVVKEALMCDLPVISTRVGDVEELLDGVSPSWVCEPTDSALGAALVECLGQPTRSNGRQASGPLTGEAVAARILALYASLAPDSVEGTDVGGASSEEVRGSSHRTAQLTP